jgi:hypothetical protein
MMFVKTVIVVPNAFHVVSLWLEIRGRHHCTMLQQHRAHVQRQMSIVLMVADVFVSVWRSSQAQSSADCEKLSAGRVETAA